MKTILSYYPGSTPVLKRYGLYSPGLDRFLLVDGLDLWGLHHAACLLASKIPTLVCIFKNGEPEFSNENCLNWSLSEKSKVVPRKQTPGIFLIESNSLCVFEGPPAGFSERMPELLKDQEFALFLLRATFAMRLADLIVGSDYRFRNEDQSLYTGFFSAEIKPTEIVPATDRTLWQNGFQGEIGAILYRAQSKEQALEQFAALATAVEPSTNLQRLAGINRKAYLEEFFQLLGSKY